MSKVSVIVPFFNASKTIKSTLDSISKQTYNQFECILIDDDSSDDSNLIAQQYVSTDKRFKLFQQTKKGVVSARNLGIKQSIGRYIAFLDADDIWDPNFLQESSGFCFHCSNQRFWNWQEYLKADFEIFEQFLQHRNGEVFPGNPRQIAAEHFDKARYDCFHLQ